MEEYTEKYDSDPSYINEEDESSFPITHIYEVKVRVKNISNDYPGEQGIDFRQYTLSGTDYKLGLEYNAYAISNRTIEGSLCVSVEKGDEFDENRLNINTMICLIIHERCFMEKALE